MKIRNQGKEFNAGNVKVSVIYNQNVQTPLKKRENHSKPPGVIMSLMTMKRMITTLATMLFFMPPQ